MAALRMNTWTHKQPCLIASILLSLVAAAQCKIYETQDLEEVMVVDKGTGMVQVTSLDPRTRLEVHLVVVDAASGARGEGEVVRVKRQWLEEDKTHNITLRQYIDTQSRCRLSVQFDGVQITQASDTSSLPPSGPHCGSTIIYLKGKADITQHPWEEEQPTVSKTPPPRSTIPLARVRGVSVRVERRVGVEESTDNWNNKTPALNTTSVTPHNTTTDGNKWWAFIFVLGETGGVPVLALLLLCLLLGVVLGGLAIYLCQRRRYKKYKFLRKQPARSITLHADIILNTQLAGSGSLLGSKYTNSLKSDYSTTQSGRATPNLNTFTDPRKPFAPPAPSSANSSLDRGVRRQNTAQRYSINRKASNGIITNSVDRSLKIPITSHVKNSLDRATNSSANSSYDRRSGYQGQSFRSLNTSRSGSGTNTDKLLGSDLLPPPPASDRVSQPLEPAGVGLGEGNNRLVSDPVFIEDTYQTPYGLLPEHEQASDADTNNEIQVNTFQYGQNYR